MNGGEGTERVHARREQDEAARRQEQDEPAAGNAAGTDGRSDRDPAERPRLDHLRRGQAVGAVSTSPTTPGQPIALGSAVAAIIGLPRLAGHPPPPDLGPGHRTGRRHAARRGLPGWPVTEGATPTAEVTDAAEGVGPRSSRPPSWSRTILTTVPRGGPPDGAAEAGETRATEAIAHINPRALERPP